MASPTNDWTFAQVEGPSDDRKLLVLTGWYAPFGRPRKDAIFKELVKSRIQTTRYPGSPKQTRHAFGANWEPIELKGRWMTKAGGDTAQNMAELWISFVRDERTCRIAWGNITSWTGYVEELELGHESENEIAWRMRIQLDQREDASRHTAAASTSPRSLVNNALQDAGKFLAGATPSTSLKDKISPDLLDTLDSLAASLNAPAATIARIGAQLDNIEKRTYQTLQHFRGAVSNMRTAIANMRDTIMGAEIDSAILIRSAKSDLEWASYANNFDVTSMVVLDDLNKLDRTAELSMKTEATKFITAVDGDTWESLARRATGSIEKAGEIRALNGARYGQKPTPGEAYLVL